MRTIRLCLALSLAAALLAGCDSQSAQISAAQQKLDRALRTFALAQQGYAPVANGEPQDLQAYRQQQLATVVDDLRGVIDTGSAEQKKTASRLLASVHLSAARYDARQALAKFATLGARTPVLDAGLRAAERASALVSATSVDFDGSLAQLAADASALAEQQTELRQQADTLTQQIEQLRGEQSGIQSQAQQRMTAAAEAGQAAFIAEGDDQSSHLERASAASLDASKLASQAENAQVEIDVRQRRLDVVQAQLDTVTKQIADLRTQADLTRQQQQASQQAVAAAGQVLSEQAGALRAEFDARAGDYAQVAELFQSAASRCRQAVDLLAGAEPAEQLGALMDEAFVNTERALTSSAWASVAGMVAAVAAQGELPDAAAYQTAQERAAADHAAAVEAAGAAIATARELASSLGDAATQQAAILESYTKRLAR